MHKLKYSTHQINLLVHAFKIPARHDKCLKMLQIQHKCNKSIPEVTKCIPLIVILQIVAYILFSLKNFTSHLLLKFSSLINHINLEYANKFEGIFIFFKSRKSLEVLKYYHRIKGLTPTEAQAIAIFMSMKHNERKLFQ